MKTVSVAVDDATWAAAARAASAKRTTLDALVAGFVKQVASEKADSDEERDAIERAKLVDALRSCNAAVGEKPTRERTYSDRRFHRH